MRHILYLKLDVFSKDNQEHVYLFLNFVYLKTFFLIQNKKSRFQEPPQKGYFYLESTFKNQYTFNLIIS